MLEYSLTFAGIPFVADTARTLRMRMQPSDTTEDESQLPPRKQQTEVDLVDEINRIIPLQYLQDFVSESPYPGRNLGALANKWKNNFPNTTLRIGDWYYPNGASRFSVFRGLATSAQAKAMLAATGGTQAKSFVMKANPIAPYHADDAATDYTLTTSLYMLPPRPLAEHGGKYDGLYLITLVDERYYWNDPVSLKVTQSSTWASLITQIANALGKTFTYNAIDAVYSKPEPDSQLWTNAEDVSVLLDAIAYSTGRVVVRALNGTYNLMSPLVSYATAIANRGDVMKVARTAGGDVFSSGTKLPIGNLNKSRNAVVPASVQVTFPKYVVGDDPVPHLVNTRYQNQRPSAWYEQSYGDTYPITVPITSGGSFVSGMSGISSVAIHSTAKALLSGEVAINSGTPLNQSGLVALAVQLAKDYYNAQVSIALDEVYPGTYAWSPEGIHDIIWTYSTRSRTATTRVLRTEWNALIREMQQSAPALSGQTNVPRGVGGPSVAQTWRDNYSIENLFRITSGMASGELSLYLDKIDNLPTGDRWRARINSGLADDETILCEPTSGLDSAIVSVAYRGIDGSVQVAHTSGAIVNWVLPQQSYGTNLVTMGDGFFAHQRAWTSGGISETRIPCPLRSVRVLSASGLLINGINCYSGVVTNYSVIGVSGSQFVAQENVWVADRNAVILQSGKYYDGQLVGYSSSGSVAPVYLTNETASSPGGGGITSGPGVIISGMYASGGINTFALSSGSVRWEHLTATAVRSGHIGSGAVCGGFLICSGGLLWFNYAPTSIRSGVLSSGSIPPDALTTINWPVNFVDQIALTGINSPAQITADQNDYNPANLATTNVLRLDTDAPRTITGLAGGSTGRIITITNVGSNPIIFANQNGGSAASNQFMLGGSDQYLFSQQSMTLRWDVTLNAWVLFVSILSSGCIRSGYIANAAVVSGSFASGIVSRFALASGAVNSGHIASGAITSGAIASGVVLGLGLGGDIHAYTDTTEGRFYYGPMILSPSFGTSTLQSGYLYAIPLWAPRGGAIDLLTLRTINGNSGALARVGIYNNTSPSDLRPSTLLIDGGALDLSGAGYKTANVSGSAILNGGGLYWLAYIVNNTAPVLQSMPTASMYPILSSFSGAFSAAFAFGWIASNGYGALPANFPASPSGFIGGASQIVSLAYHFYA